MKKHLYEIFADRWYHNGSIFVYSDPHFGDLDLYKKTHVKNIELRNGKVFYENGCNWEDGKSLEQSLKEFDDFKVQRINSVVGKNDTLIILGDVGDVSYVKKLRGYKVLLLGNHDSGASNYQRTYPYVEQYGDDEPITYGKDNHLFDEVYDGPLMVNDRLILSHEPIENLPKYFFNIHGHDHSGANRGSNYLNVCCELLELFKPFNLSSALKDGLLSHIPSIHRSAIDTANKRKSKKGTL